MSKIIVNDLCGTDTFSASESAVYLGDTMTSCGEAVKIGVVVSGQSFCISESRKLKSNI